MNLFLVEYRNAYDNYEYSGIFSTKEKAEEHVKKYGVHDQPNFCINEVTVDE